MISRPGETFTIVLSELNFSGSTLSHTCGNDYLQIEGEGRGGTYCGKSEKLHEFQVRGNVAIRLRLGKQCTLNKADDVCPDTGFVMKIRNTTGTCEFQAVFICEYPIFSKASKLNKIFPSSKFTPIPLPQLPT